MQYIWDTHALIWAVQDYDRLSERVKYLASQASAPAMSAISLWEVSMLVDRKRIIVKQSLKSWFEELLSAVHVLHITPEIAVKAYDLGEFHGDPADRLIAATALCHGLELVTKDGRLRAYRPLTCIW
jgi:PIN domain nuclease of toxin-antitoxin system